MYHFVSIPPNMAKHFLLSILIAINDHAKYINKSTYGQGW